MLYLQEDLGLSSLQSGLRFLVVSGSIFVSATIAGRLTSSVPAKWLLVPGFALIGTGIVLLGAIHVGRSWTDLIPGFVVGGIGAGCVNVPLSSTAGGVVDPSRSGMASGLSSTMRQVEALGREHRYRRSRRARRLGASASEHGFVAGMDRIFVVAAAAAAAVGACCVPLIRQRDLEAGARAQVSTGPGPAVG